MRPSARFLLPLSLASLALLAAARPALAQPVMIDVRDCLALEGTLERYACYEDKAAAAQGRQQERAPATASPAPSPAAPRDEPAQSARQSREEFGLRNEPSELEKEAEREAEELRSSITALEERLPDRFLITLENGQVWRNVTSRNYRLRVGHEVRIYPSAWGQSYRLTVPELRGFVQVERVR